MCIVVRKGTCQIAEEDIQTWKIVRIRKLFPNKWFGLFYAKFHGFKFDVTLDETTPVEHETAGIFDYLTVGPGYFHSFEYAYKASNLYSWLVYHNPKKKYACIKTIIPKGAKYYNNSGQYASNKIIVPKPKN